MRCRNRRGVETDLLVAEDVAERYRGSAEHVAAARDADVDRRPPVEEQLPNAPLRRLFSAISVCESGAWKSMIGPGAPKSAVAAMAIGSRRSSECSSHSPL